MSEKKVGKRLLTWVLVLVMTLSLLPLNVLAENSISPASILPPDTKCIVYTFYNGSEIVDKQEIKNNESLEVPATPEKEGYQFTGWFDQNGTEFTNFGIAITVTEDSTGVDLYAKFVPVCYVYFMDGKGTDARIIATKEVTATDPLNDFSDVAFPIGADEAITGWVDKDNNPVTSVSFSDGTTYLYPVVGKGHWIEFNSNGGSYVAPQFVTDTTKEPTPPTKPGYDFVGWYTNEETNNEFEFGNILSNNLTLYAKWTPNNRVSYTVIHWWENANDDGYSFHERETKYGKVGDPTNAAAKTYSITDKSLTGQSITRKNVFSPQAIEQQTIKNDGSTIVNIYYKRAEYKLSFGYYQWKVFWTEWKEIASITKKYGENISSSEWPKNGNQANWEIDNSEKYIAYLSTMPLDGGRLTRTSDEGGENTATYYVETLNGSESGAICVDNRWFIVHHYDKTKGTSGNTVGPEDRYAITGFEPISNLGTQVGQKYKNAKFYYSRSSYDIVYVNTGAKDNDKHTVSYKFEASITDAGNYEPTTPPAGKEGYVFAGWYDAPTGGSRFDFANKTMPAQNITVYAKWVEPVHKVEFLVDNKVVTEWTKTDVAHNSTISDLPTPTSSNGDTFLGWVDANRKPFHPSTKITGDLKLYAKFGNKTGYSVTYVTAEGSSSFTDDKLYAEGAYATVRDGASTAPAGKVFLYWNASSDSSGKKYYPNDKVLVPKGGVTLTAVYGDKAETVTLTYNANFGTPPASTQISGLKNNGLIDLLSYDELELPKRDGYTFTGWNTQQDGHGISFAAGTSAARVDKVEPNVLYAQWKKTTIDEEVTVIITGKTDTKVYNGSEQSVTGYEVKSISNELYKTTDFTFNGTATATGTDADTYQMGLKPENFENKNANFSKVTFVVTDGSLTITKRDVTLTSASASKPYDGTALTSKNVTVGGNGFADGEGATYNVTGSQTEVGKSDNEFTYELNANTKANNYNITMYKGELVITAADSVAYKVEHYKQNLDGSYNDTPNDIDPLSGTAGTLTAAAAKDYPGFTPGTVTQEKIKSDGTTTVEIQYTRNSYTLTINYVYRDGSKAAESHIETILYGKDYSVTSPKISGYTADKLVVSGTMPADNRTVTVTYTKNGGHHPRPKPTVEIEDDDALGLNTTDHFAYIVGYGNGEVRPQNNITRAEVATIFFRLLTDDVRDENLTKTNRYSDVAATSWYNTAVSTLSSMGIITGYPDGTFRPNAAITRAEFAAIAARFDHDGDKTAAKFSDIASHWAKDEISIAYNNGWITGYPNSTFGPQRDITRAETMTLVNRVLNRQPETEDDLLPNMTVWTDNANPKAWYYLAVQEATNSHYYEFKTNSQYEKWTELRETRDWTQLEK